MRTEMASVREWIRPGSVPGQFYNGHSWKSYAKEKMQVELAGARAAAALTLQRGRAVGEEEVGECQDLRAVCRGPWALSEAGQGHPISGFARDSWCASEVLAQGASSASFYSPRCPHSLVNFLDTLAQVKTQAGRSELEGLSCFHGLQKVLPLCPGFALVSSRRWAVTESVRHCSFSVEPESASV